MGGKCPKKPNSPAPAPRCISCGQVGHKFGAPSCPEAQAARKALAPRKGETMASTIAKARQTEVPEANARGAKSFADAVRGAAATQPVVVLEPAIVQMDTDAMPVRPSTQNEKSAREIELESTLRKVMDENQRLKALAAGFAQQLGPAITQLQPTTGHKSQLTPEKLVEVMTQTFGALQQFLVDFAGSSNSPKGTGTDSSQASSTGTILRGL